MLMRWVGNRRSVHAEHLHAYLAGPEAKRTRSVEQRQLPSPGKSLRSKICEVAGALLPDIGRFLNANRGRIPDSMARHAFRDLFISGLRWPKPMACRPVKDIIRLLL